MRQLLISALPGDLQMAWLEGGALQNFLVERAGEGPRPGALYLGRIDAIDRGLGAAFVALGEERSGLLPLEEVPEGTTEGAPLLVEVARAAQGGKGPRLRSKGLDRTAAARASRDKIPQVIDPGPDALEAALKAVGQGGIEEILVEDLASYRRAKTILEQDGRSGRIAFHRPKPGEGGGLFGACDLEARLESLLRPEVSLPSGARLRIEPSRTLVAVDVDSAGSGQRGKAAMRSLAINREAAEALAGELRLRALSGLIVVDFLALPEAAARKDLERCLRRALERDPAKSRVFPMRPSGLLDMTRQRLRRPLHEILGEPCGSLVPGWRLSAETCAFAALRRLRGLPPKDKAKAWRLQASPAVLAALEGPVRLAREAMEEEMGRPLDLEERADYDRAGNYIWEIVPA